MQILFGLLTAIVGVVLVFAGYRFARIIIPIMGFVSGLSIGGAVISAMASTPFLGTVLGVTLGLVLGAVFALIAYLFYAAAIIVLAGSLGYWLGSSFVLFLGLNRGFLSALVGLAVGVAIGLLALVANAPKYVLIVYTAIAGAVLTVGGTLLLFNQVPLDTFSYSAARVAITNSTFWSLVTLALAVVGGATQYRSTEEYEFDTWNTLGAGHGMTLQHH